jgi:hypothetical protein
LGAATWYDEEPPLRPAALRALARLGRRGRISWIASLIAAILIGGLATVQTIRASRLYTVTVALRVSEGQVDTNTHGNRLNGATLRAHVKDLALTNRRLVELLRKHPESFGRVEDDGGESVTEMRDAITVDILEDDFIGDRAAEGRPRTARIEITYKNADPKLAWTVAQELGELVIGTTLGGARAAIERARAAAAAAVSQAEAHAEPAAPLEEALPNAPTVGAAATAAAVAKTDQRLAAAGGQEMEADLSLHALEQNQGLRFEVVDPGRVPVPLPRVSFPGLLAILVVSSLGGCLSVGALDPRILDFEDLAAMGVPALGMLPALPGGRGKGSVGKREEASDVPPQRV